MGFAVAGAIGGLVEVGLGLDQIRSFSDIGLKFLEGFFIGGFASLAFLGVFRLFGSLFKWASKARKTSFLQRFTARISRIRGRTSFGGQVPEAACGKCSVQVAQRLGLNTTPLDGGLDAAIAARTDGIVDALEGLTFSSPIGGPAQPFRHWVVKSGDLIVDKTIVANAKLLTGGLKTNIPALAKISGDTFTLSEYMKLRTLLIMAREGML